MKLYIVGLYYHKCQMMGWSEYGVTTLIHPVSLSLWPAGEQYMICYQLTRVRRGLLRIVYLTNLFN